MGAGVAVTPERVLTAHYLVLRASRLEVVGLDGRTRGPCDRGYPCIA
jgi:hypothetical protein